MMRPADVARRARELADKREKSAAASAPHVREQLLATARNYRALAAELERKVRLVAHGAHTADPVPHEVSRAEAVDDGYRGANGQNRTISGTPSTTTRIESGNPRRQ